MGIYYIAVFEDDTYIESPPTFADKYPGIIAPSNPFPQICMLKVYVDRKSFGILDDVGAEYEHVVENFINESEKWFNEWKKIFPEWAE
jgi:hypothetical protein